MGRDFYIAGESYGGVYVPTTARYILDVLEGKITNPNPSVFDKDTFRFRGFSVGNGYISSKWDIDTLADFMYAHGLYGKSEWDSLRTCCKEQNTSYCELTQWLNPDGTPFQNGSIPGTACSWKAYTMTEDRQWFSGYDTYNIYQSCYGYSVPSMGGSCGDDCPPVNSTSIEDHKNHVLSHVEKNKKIMAKHGYLAAYVDQFSRMNYASSDADGGFQCYMTNAATNYLNSPHVREALHIPDYVGNWEFCR